MGNKWKAIVVIPETKIILTELAQVKVSMETFKRAFQAFENVTLINITWQLGLMHFRDYCKKQKENAAINNDT